MTHPHPNRRFVPQAVLTKSGKITIVGASVNTAGSKTTMNHPRPITNAYKKGYSQVTRQFNKYSANKNSIFNKKVNTIRVKVTTARDRAITVYKEWEDRMERAATTASSLEAEQDNGKFDGKTDEGFFVGYFVVSKAMRVFNKRTKIVEETLNIRFLENAPNVTGNGPDWLFDVDSLTKSMNYVPVVAGNQTNGITGTRDNIVTGQAEKKTEPEQEYILIPFCITDPLISQGPKDSEEDSGMKPTEVDESGASDKDGEDDQAIRSEFERLLQQEKQTVHPNSTNSINTVSTPVSNSIPSFTNDAPSSPINAARTSEEHLFEQFSPFKNAFTLPDVPNVSPIDDNTGIFAGAYDDEDVGRQADLNNLETTMNVSPILTTRIDKDHPKDQIIRVLTSAIQTRRMTKISDEHAMMDVKSDFLYGTIEEDVYVFQPPEPGMRRYETLSTYLIENGFRRGTIDKTLFIKKDKGDILLVQVYVDDIIFGSTKKSLCDEFEDKYVAEILKKIDFATVKTTSTPIETNKALVKDEEAEAVDVHLYRLMIGSLMYLTASRLDIMFVVCACARVCNIKRGQDTKIPQSGGLPIKVGDEAVHKELSDRMEMATTTSSSLKAE
ncbi:hypothetical protein Tco_0889464 [Tanacetum coccineum]